VWSRSSRLVSFATAPGLFWRAWNGAVGAEDTAIARSGPQPRSATRAVIEEPARVRGHGFFPRMATGRARDFRFQYHRTPCVNQGGNSPRRQKLLSSALQGTTTVSLRFRRRIVLSSTINHAAGAPPGVHRDRASAGSSCAASRDRPSSRSARPAPRPAPGRRCSGTSCSSR